jgi:hypothetical protein
MSWKPELDVRMNIVETGKFIPDVLSDKWMD